MKVYITGIAGFIGYHTACFLREHGHEVTGCDNYNDYYDVDLKRHRAKLLNYRQITIDELDINDMTSDSLGDSEIVLHLAAYAGVRASLEDPYSYIQTNIVGTQRVIDACTEANVPVLYASTSSVGSGVDLPFTEDSPFTHHKNPYAWSKYNNECQFKHSKLPESAGLRFFTVYGPWGRPDMALFTFADLMTKGEPIELYNYGKMKRDFTYVKDIVQGVYIVMKEVYNRQEQRHELYNIGYGKMEELVDYVEILEEGLGIVAEKKLVPHHPADVLASWADITKISALGYKPTTSIRDGVSAFTDWYKEYYK